MKKIIKIITITLGLVIAAPAQASSPTNALSSCLVDTLNGKERKSLAKWIFFSIAAHPEINTYSSASIKDINKSDQYVGKLITRILTIDCPKELKTANNADPLAIQKAFEVVGQVAMQELMANENVMKTITNYAKYTDQDKINRVLSNN